MGFLPYRSSVHAMRLIFFLCLAVATALAASQESQFEFLGNASNILDPHGLLNYRWVSYNSSSNHELIYYRSLRSPLVESIAQSSIDTIGGLVSSTSLPMASMAFWDFNASLTQVELDIASSSAIMATAYSTLIERSPTGSIIKSYSLANAPSNMSAGVHWNITMDSDLNSTLYWIRMEAEVPLPSDEYPNQTFELEIVWFLSLIRGRVDLGATEITPRMLESVVRIKGYKYAATGNRLALRVLCAHSSASYESETGRIHSGQDLSELYVSLSGTVQVLPNAGALSGPEVNVSLSEWQSSPGLRIAVGSSVIGTMMNAKYGGNWDVRFAEVEFPPNARFLLYDPTLGTGFSISPPADETLTPSYIPSTASNKSFPQLSTLFLLLICVLITNLS